MSARLSGPSFEPRDSGLFESQIGKSGGHYNLFRITGGMDALRSIFPDGEANELNFVLFSTSGVHGTYNTLEEIEEHFANPDGDGFPEITLVIVHPRLCTLRYGAFEVEAYDIPYLKKLRATSWAAVMRIGAHA